MGMGYSGVELICVNIEDLQKLQSFNVFTSTVGAQTNLELADFALLYHEMEEFDELADAYDIEEADIKAQFETVKTTFEAFTKDFYDTYNVKIFIEHHNQEDIGDRYDDVDGVHFSLSPSDLYELTPAGKRLYQDIPFQSVSYVQYG